MTHTTSEDKFDDCVSCAFSDQDHPICDTCDYGDQWEPYYDGLLEDSEKKKVIKIHKLEHIEKIAA